MHERSLAPNWVSLFSVQFLFFRKKPSFMCKPSYLIQVDEDPNGLGDSCASV